MEIHVISVNYSHEYRSFFQNALPERKELRDSMTYDVQICVR